GPAGTIASPATRQRAAAPASTRVTGRMLAMRSTLPWTSPTPRAIVRAADRNGADSNQRGPLPRRAPGVGLVSGASGEGGAAPLLFGLLSFLLLLAIPTAVRWLRPAAALGLCPAVVVSGPNVALANGSSCSPCGGSGTTTQNSGNTVDASATNTATQSNNQSNAAGQTQTVSGGNSGSTDQSADQSNSGSNSADQSASSKPVVVSGPNVAALNSGDVNQNSGNNVDASTSNNANQSNTQSNRAGQSQTVAGSGRCCHKHGGDVSQSADQSNSGSNSADQSAYSAPVVVSGPNVAVANGWGHSACNPCGGGGGVSQNSGNAVYAPASNSATQSNTQSNALGQTQTVDRGSSCCRKAGDVSQSAEQSNWAENSANQRAYSAPVVVSGGNYAFFNKGGTTQNSGNAVYAPASNSATQSNNQSNSLGQTQSVQGGGCCPSSDCSSCDHGCESDCGSKCDRGCEHPCRSHCSKC